MATNDIGITVPLLILISLGIASLNRQYSLSDLEYDTFEFSFWRWEQTIRHLGPFTVTHGLNHVFVLLAFSLSQAAYSGGSVWSSFISRNTPPSLLLTGIIFFYALFYPYLEVTEYQKIPSTDNSIFPVSIQAHYLFTGLTILISTVDTFLIRKYGPPATGIDTIFGILISVAQMTAAVLEMVLLPVTILLYSSFLLLEMEENYTD